jgi:putative DNA primase/helicase
MAFLNHVLDGDKELIDYVQRFVGYSLTGLAREQCWAILYGLGSNGKSLFLSVLRALLGEQEYARHTPSETLLATKNSERVRNDLARLQGARLVTATETESGQRLAEALVKQMTGEDPVTARFLYREYFEFVPTFKLWLAVNFTPRIRSDDPASWRRVRLIPFTVTIPDARQDKQLQGKLLTELPGIMNWALEGCLKWQRRKDGLRPPTRVTEATAQYRREMDTVGRFIEEECVTGPHEWASAADLYEKYGGWCNETGEATESQKEFGTQLRRRGFVNGKQRGIRGWQGLGLRKPDPALRVVA